jgi:hypothetical protein
VLIRRGDCECARSKLGALVAGKEVARAKELLSQGDPRGAMAVLDRAVAIAPESADLLCMRAEAALAIGEKDGEREFLQSALDDFLRSAEKHSSARAWLGASRAARRLSLPSRALEYARNGVAELSEHEMLALPIAPERTLAEAGFDAWRSSRGASETPEHEADREDRARECQRALEDLIGREPEDVAAWRDLAALHLDRGESTAARSVALHGLCFALADPGLHATLAAAAQAMGGGDAVVATYAELARRQPGAAPAEWYPAVARFEQALELLAEEQDASALLEAAQAGFARCAKLDAAYADDCALQIALCRTGLGWSRLAKSDLDGARTAFLASEDARAGGLKAEVPGKLASALVGLNHVGAAYRERSNSRDLETSSEYLARASRIYDYLAEYDAANPDWTSFAGDLARSAADALKIRADELAGRDEADEANRVLERAKELAEKSFRSYAAAAKLAPDDVAVANEAGHLLVIYLQRDVSTAEQYLKRAAELGQDQVPKLRARAAETGLDEKERRARQGAFEEVENALGDAYQNLGVLYLTLKGDARTAREFFEKSLKTGVDPREAVGGEHGFLRQCDDALQKQLDPKIKDDARWDAHYGASPKNETRPAGAPRPPKQP